MILVTRLTGAAFAVNPDLLERVEATPDTVLTLIDGTKYLVAETVVEVIELVREYRASVVATARSLREPLPAPQPSSDGRPDLHVVPAQPTLRVLTRETTPEEV